MKASTKFKIMAIVKMRTNFNKKNIDSKYSKLTKNSRFIINKGQYGENAVITTEKDKSMFLNCELDIPV